MYYIHRTQTHAVAANFPRCYLDQVLPGVLLALSALSFQTAVVPWARISSFREPLPAPHMCLDGLPVTGLTPLLFLGTCFKTRQL